MDFSPEDLKRFEKLGLDPEEIGSEVKKKKASEFEGTVIQAAEKADGINERLKEAQKPVETPDPAPKKEGEEDSSLLSKAGSDIKKSFDGPEDVVNTALSVGQGLTKGLASAGNLIGDIFNGIEEITGLSELAKTDTGRSVANFLNRENAFDPKVREGFDPDKDGFFFEGTVNFEAPDLVGDRELTGTQQIIGGFAQFAAGLKLARTATSAVSAASGVSASGKLGSISKFVTDNGLADIVAFSEEEAKFSDVIKQAGFENQYLTFLATNPKDTQAVKIFKQFIEGNLLGGAFEGVLKSPALVKKLSNFVVDTSNFFRHANVVKSVVKDTDEVAGKVAKKLDEGAEVLEEDVKRTKPDVSLNDSKTQGNKAVDSFNKKVEEFRDGKPFRSKSVKASDKDTAEAVLSKEGDAILNNPGLKTVGEQSRISSIEEFDKLDFDAQQKFVQDLGVADVKAAYKEFQKAAATDNPNEFIKRRLTKIAYRDDIIFPEFQKVLKDPESSQEQIQDAFRTYLDVAREIDLDIKFSASTLGAERRIAQSASAQARRNRKLRELQSRDLGAQETLEIARKILDIYPENDKVIQGFFKNLVSGGFDAAEILRRGTSYYYKNLLSSPLTTAIAGLDGAFSKPVIKAIGEYPIALKNVITKNSKGIQIEELNAFYNAYIRSLPEALGQMGRTFKTGELPGNFTSKVDFNFVDELAKDPNAPVGSLIPKVFDFVIGGGLRGLKAVDAGISVLAHNSAVAETSITLARLDLDNGLIKAEELQKRIEFYNDNPRQSQLKKALEYAQDATLTAPLKGAAGSFDEVLKRSPGGQILFPFFKPSVNIIKQTFEHTPYRYGSALFKKSREEYAVMSARQKDVYHAKVLAGTGIMAIAATGYANGVITGDRPADFRKSAGFPPGYQFNSVRIGDTYIGFDKLGYLGLLLRMGTKLAEGVKKAEYYTDKEEPLAATQAITQAVMLSVPAVGFTPTMLVDTASQYAALLDPATPNVEDKLKKLAAKKAVGFVPASSLLRQVRRITDDKRRDKRTYEGDGYFDVFKKEIKDVIPYFSDDLPEVKDIFGDPIITQSGFANKAISPLKTSTVRKGDEVLHDKMIELGFDRGEGFSQDVDGEKDPENLLMPLKSFRFGGQTIPLTGEQYHKILDLSAGKGLDFHPFQGTEHDGKTFKEVMRDEIKSGFPFLQKVGRDPKDLDHQRWAFKRIYSNFKSAARVQFKKENLHELVDRKKLLDEQEQDFSDR